MFNLTVFKNRFKDAYARNEVLVNRIVFGVIVASINLILLQLQLNLINTLIALFLIVVQFILVCQFGAKLKADFGAKLKADSIEASGTDNIKDRFHASNMSISIQYCHLDALLPYIAKTKSYLSTNFVNQLNIIKEVSAYSKLNETMTKTLDQKLAKALDTSTDVKNKSVNAKKTLDDLSTSLESLDQIGSLIGEVSAVLSLVVEKLTGITEINKMTKLISFNASVEAARAGIHGQTFAVVAKEMGELALKITNISNEIEKIIDIGEKKMETIQQSISKKLSDSSQIITGSREEFGEVLKDIQVLSGEISEGFEAVSQYSASSRELNQSADKFTRVSNALGLAAANLRLIEQHVYESKLRLVNFNKIHGTEDSLDDEEIAA